MTSPSLASPTFVRFFRLWSAARSAGENPLPHMHDAMDPFAPAPELAIACASLFDLVEAHLERRLVPECCCSHEVSRDEQALLGILQYAAESGLPLTRQSIPHGLPGAIRWAAFAVRRALGRSFGEAFERPDAPGELSNACPFSARADAVNRLLPSR